MPGLTINRSPLQGELNAPHHYVWPLVVQVFSNEEGLPSEVFVYHEQGPDNDVDSIFSCVASLPQLSEIGLDPVKDLETNTIVPFFRTDTLRFDCRTPEEADDLYRRVVEDLSELLRDHRLAAAMLPSETEVLP